jgi:hypothetical protein
VTARAFAMTGNVLSTQGSHPPQNSIARPHLRAFPPVASAMPPTARPSRVQGDAHTTRSTTLDHDLCGRILQPLDPTDACRYKIALVSEKRWASWVLAAVVAIISDLVCGFAATRILAARAASGASDREFRIASPIYHHDLKPKTEGIGVWGARRYRVVTNSLGFKDRATRDVPLVPKDKRVLLIGDSFTEGIGVEYPLTFAGRIEEALAPKGIEVLNAAVGSYAPSVYWRKTKYLLEEVGLRFDELVVFIDLSDLHDEALFYQTTTSSAVVFTEWAEKSGVMITGVSPPKKRGLGDTLKELSLILRFADFIKDHYIEDEGWSSFTYDQRTMLEGLKNVERGAWTFDDAVYARYADRGLARATHAMDNLAALLKDRGVRLTIAVYPWPAQVLANDRDSKQVRIWREWASNHGARFIDLFPTFVGIGDPVETLKSYYIAGDSHFSEPGHERFAKAFLEAWQP